MADLSWTCWAGIALLVSMVVVSTLVFILGLLNAHFSRAKQDDWTPPFA